MDNRSILNVQPPKFEWRVYRNDSTVLTIAMVDSNDNAIEIAGWNFSCMVREFPDSANALTEPVISVNQNFLTVTLNTENLERINYFDIQAFNDSTNQTKTILSGQIYVEEDVTR
jgi:hypothetical protein